MKLKSFRVFRVFGGHSRNDAPLCLAPLPLSHVQVRMRSIRLLLAVSLFALLASCKVPMPQYDKKSGPTYGPPAPYKPYTYAPVEGTTRSRGKSSSSSTWYNSDGSTSKKW
jgi:hypothetical protein